MLLHIACCFAIVLRLSDLKFDYLKIRLSLKNFNSLFQYIWNNLSMEINEELVNSVINCGANMAQKCQPSNLN